MLGHAALDDDEDPAHEEATAGPDRDVEPGPDRAAAVPQRHGLFQGTAAGRWYMDNHHEGDTNGVAKKGQHGGQSSGAGRTAARPRVDPKGREEHRNNAKNHGDERENAWSGEVNTICWAVSGTIVDKLN